MIGPAYLGPGDLLAGRYEIVRELGRGGFSIVYLATDRSLSTPVAIKLLVPPPASAQLARERSAAKSRRSAVWFTATL